MHRMLTLAATLIVVLLTSAASAWPDHVVLDGRFDEWADIDAVHVDPADAEGAYADIGAVKVVVGARFVDLYIELGSMVNIQKLPGRGELLLDVDGDSSTGQTRDGLDGVDVVVELTPPDHQAGDRRRGGMGLGAVVLSAPMSEREARKSRKRPVSSVERISPHDLGLAFAPTHASDRVELRLNRGTRIGKDTKCLLGRAFTAKLLLRDAKDAIVDETDAFTIPIRTRYEPGPREMQGRDPIHLLNRDAVRVVSWNVEWGHLFEDSARFGRILKTLDPDVVLFQELTDKNTSQQLTDLMRSIAPAGEGQTWHALVGEGGGNLRGGVASRLPMEAVESLRIVAFPNGSKRTVRVAAAAVEHDGRSILVGSLHLKCCGSIGSREDETRIIEVRQLHEAFSKAKKETRCDAMILAGDFNLVGARKPIDVLAAGLDLDDSELHIVEALQIDGLSNATWSDPKQPFVPGRLDFMLITDTSLAVHNAFVLDSQDIMPYWLREHPLRIDDTGQASDHLPLIADLLWTASPKRTKTTGGRERRR